MTRKLEDCEILGSKKRNPFAVFPLWLDRWHGSTVFFTMSSLGRYAYLQICFAQWRLAEAWWREEGQFMDDPAGHLRDKPLLISVVDLPRVSTLTTTEFTEVCAEVQTRLFEVKPGFFANEVVTGEILKKVNYLVGNRNKGKNLAVKSVKMGDIPSSFSASQRKKEEGKEKRAMRGEAAARREKKPDPDGRLAAQRSRDVETREHLAAENAKAVEPPTDLSGALDRLKLKGSRIAPDASTGEGGRDVATEAELSTGSATGSFRGPSALAEEG